MSMKSRYIGAGVSLIGAIPISVLSANAFTLISGKNIFSKASDAMVTGITFGQYEGISEHVKEIKDALEVGTQKDLQDHISDIFTNNSSLDQISPEDYKTINDLLNGKSTPLIIESASGSLREKLQSIKDNPITTVNDQGSHKFEVETNQ